MNESRLVFGSRVTLNVSLTALPFHVYGAEVNGARVARSSRRRSVSAPASAGQVVEVTPFPPARGQLEREGRFAAAGPSQSVEPLRCVPPGRPEDA